MKISSIVVGAALAGAVAVSSSAAKLGDPAAPLAIKEWVKGKAVDVKDGKNVYVVEFWATWCGPCRVSIPHLTELQKKFKDKSVVFVGISDETADKVKPFVRTQGAKMDYTVAIDEARKTSEGYMEAYAQSGIPCAFIVGKDGKVLWFGHPMAGLEEALADVVAGKFDVKAAVKRDERRAALAEYHRLSQAGDAKAKALGQTLLADSGDDLAALCEFAFGIAANTMNERRDFALAEAALAKAEKLAGGKDHRVLSVRAIARFENGQQNEGLKLLKEAAALAKDEQDKQRYQQWLAIMERRKEAEGRR